MLVMYILVSWEQIPTYVLHQFFCRTEAGLHVYVTPEQWDKQNPGELEKLVSDDSSRTEVLPNGARRYYLTDRLAWDITKHTNFFFPVHVAEYAFTDLASNIMLSKSVHVTSGYAPMALGGKGSWKFWIGSERCGPSIYFTEVEIYKDYWRNKK